ncbi:hypothetical protein KC19_VG262800 [Ceratodon purpureus]|uniref:No apical meristem-associated C-terminal domain-containing protein n=1 Tax=Ceratodon purpureus TaxID=3225 RepID=A0A8T0HVG2_CERPU|nr:hypothetical protein KC19_VG262800 [Ceratodon purpureus]
MVGAGAGRRRQEQQAAEVPVTKNTKGKKFAAEEERQLCRSVIAISQDPIVGNQQKSNAFWDRIFVHYNENRPAGERPARSLETKWGLIKHDVLRTKTSGTSLADVLKKAHELYQIKSSKGAEFSFEHCWEFVREVPRWADGWSQPKPPTPKRKEPCDSSDRESHREDTGTVTEGAPDMDEARHFRGRPGGTKAAKEVVRQAKVKEGAAWAQATATQLMAEATRRKAASMEDQNLLLLFTSPESLITPEAVEYLRLRRRREELRKLQRRLAAEEEEERRRSEAPTVTAETSPVPADRISDPAGGDQTQDPIGDAAAGFGPPWTRSVASSDQASPITCDTEGIDDDQDWLQMSHVDSDQRTQWQSLRDGSFQQHWTHAAQEPIDLDQYSQDSAGESHVHIGLSLNDSSHYH